MIETSKIVDHCRDLKEQFYVKMRANFAKCLKFFNLEIKVKPPKGFTPHTPPTARRLIDGVAGALLPNDFVVDVEPRALRGMQLSEEITKASQEQADKLKKSHYYNLKKIPIYILQESIKNTILYGMNALKGAFFDVDKWGKLPERQKGQSEEDFVDEQMRWHSDIRFQSPFNVSVVDPLNLLPDPRVFNNEEPEYAIESYDRLAFDVRRDFPDFKSDQDFDVVSWIEYYDTQKKVYICKEQVLVEDENIYGWPPYMISFSGLGKSSPYGKPEEKAVGIMYPMLSSLELEAILMTMISVVAQYAGIPPLRAPKELDGTPLSTAAGIMNYIDPIHIIEPLFKQQPEAAKAVYDGLALVGREIEYTYGKVLGGTKLPGVESGILEQLLLIQSEKKYRSVVDSLKIVYAKLAGRMAELTERFASSPISEFIKPDEIKGHYHCTVNFEMSNEAQRRANVDTIIAFLGKGVYSAETLRDAFPATQAAKDEDQRIALERMRADPRFLETLIVGAQGQAAAMRREEEVKKEPIAPRLSPTPMLPVGPGYGEEE